MNGPLAPRDFAIVTSSVRAAHTDPEPRIPVRLQSVPNTTA